MLLAHLRQGVLKPHFAGHAARRRQQIAPAHETGCSLCKVTAAELPAGEDAAHHIVGCSTFQDERDTSGLQAVIAQLKQPRRSRSSRRRAGRQQSCN